ncbi:unnamed protein product [Lampetra planeri]
MRTRHLLAQADGIFSADRGGSREATTTARCTVADTGGASAGHLGQTTQQTRGLSRDLVATDLRQYIWRQHATQPWASAAVTSLPLGVKSRAVVGACTGQLPDAGLRDLAEARGPTGSQLGWLRKNRNRNRCIDLGVSTKAAAAAAQAHVARHGTSARGEARHKCTWHKRGHWDP